LDEKPLEVLYVDLPSRANVPVNVLVRLEFLKAAYGWTDEERYDNFCYDIQGISVLPRVVIMSIMNLPPT
jgi:hypothetical protein